MWQIFRTDKRGRITGETYTDPAVAVATFISDFKYAKSLYAEICFRDVGELVVRVADEKLQYVIIKKGKMGHWVSVEFSCLDLEGTKAYVEKFIPHSTDITVLSFKTGDIEYEYHE